MLIADKPNEQLPNKLDSRFCGNDSDPAGNNIGKLSWKDSVTVQKLLDTISQILAEEYCRIAKDNPEIFCQKGN